MNIYSKSKIFLLLASLWPLTCLAGQRAADKNVPPSSSAASTNVAPGTNVPPASSPVKPAPAPELLKIIIGSSRASVTRDGSYGVFADLENVSSEVVTITPGETVLVVQPEVSQPDACVDSEIGIFPALPKPANTGTNTSEIHLQPKEHYKVFWDLSRREHKTNCPQQSGVRDYLGFVPGDYAFTVEGIAYTPPSNGQPPLAHTYTETTTLRVSISQMSTALAAFLGALLAYLVVALQPGHDFDRWRPGLPPTGQIKIAAVLLRNAFSAGLLGSAVTIVASRLSDTQFPIKVSVSDFWGALTIGFVAYFAGTKFIASIATRFAVPPSNAPGGPPPVGNVPAGTPPVAGEPAPKAAGAQQALIG